MSGLGRKAVTTARTGSRPMPRKSWRWLDETPDITLGEIAAHLDAGHGLTVAQSTVWRLLDRHGMTFKKNRARLRATAS